MRAKIDFFFFKIIGTIIGVTFVVLIGSLIIHAGA